MFLFLKCFEFALVHKNRRREAAVSVVLENVVDTVFHHIDVVIGSVAPAMGGKHDVLQFQQRIGSVGRFFSESVEPCAGDDSVA